MFIPMLENEVIDNNRSNFFLEKLEELYRNEAFLVHLQKKAEEPPEDGERVENPNLVFENRIDHESLLRRQAIFDEIKERQREQKREGKSQASSYKGVVSEVELFDYDSSNVLAALGKLFVTGRKLKPVVKAKSTVPFQN